MIACAILAAGASSRMGRDKAELRVRGISLLDRAIEACAGYETIVVLPSRLDHLVPPDCTTVCNDEPKRGMTHSARLASAEVSPRASLVVVLVDMPYVDAELVRWVAEAPDAEIAYPLVGGRAGHPVRFGPAARQKLRSLPDGDTLRTLRDDPTLSRITFAVRDANTQIDLDTPADVRNMRL